MHIIGLSGLPNAGKDTAADYLVHSYGYIKLSMGHPIRELVYTLYMLDKGWMNDRYYESQPLPQLSGKTVKEVLQVIGRTCTEIHDAVWVNSVLSNLDPTQIYVVSDVRRPCEIDTIKDMGGVGVYINSNQPLPSDGRDMSHESESHHQYLLNSADYSLSNTSTLKDYYQKIDDLHIQRLRT
jgi:hypothetical protein